MQQLTREVGRAGWYALRIVLVLALLASLTPVAGLADTSATLRFAPQPLMVEAGATFTVDVWVDDVVALYGAQVYIDFEPLLLEVTNVAYGPLLSPGSFSSLTWNNNVGQVNIQIAQMAPSAPVSGSGSLAEIKFRGKAAGSSPLRFVDRSLALRTLLTTAEIPGEITTVKQDGQVTVYSLARLDISPVSTSVTAGQRITYSARVYDSNDTLVNTVTGSTTFAIDAGAGGTWLGATYVSAKAGVWTVTASYTSPAAKRLVDTASLTVTAAAPDTLTLAAVATELAVGENTMVTATVSDAYGNAVADGTVVTFACNQGDFGGGATTVQAGTVNGVATATFTSTVAGTATLMATAGDANDSLQIVVTAVGPGPEPGPGPTTYRLCLPIVARNFWPVVR